MAFASGATARAAYIAEVTPGTTPATPTFQTMRVTSSSMRPTKTTGVSEERQPDRNVREEFLLGQDAGGGYNFELSYGSFDDILAAALFGSWSANVLKNGVARTFFTFEETLELGATDSFHRYVMSMIDTLSIDIQAGQPITGSFEAFSKSLALATTAITGATYTAPNTKAVMTAGASVAGLSVAGLAPAPQVRRLQLQVRNNLRRRPVVGSLNSEEYGEGLCDVTGTLEAYFGSNALYQQVLDHGGGAIAATIGQVANEKYTLTVPAAVWLDGAAQIGGNNDDVIVTIPFRGKYDATEAASLKIERAVA